MNGNPWARLLVYVTGQVNQELLQNEYLAAENRVLRAHLPGRLRLSDPERRTLAEIGKRVGRKSSGEGVLRGQARHDSDLVPVADRPQVQWFSVPYVSWPTPDSARVEELVVRFARENSGWGAFRRELVVALLRPNRSKSADRSRHAP